MLSRSKIFSILFSLSLTCLHLYAQPSVREQLQIEVDSLSTGLVNLQRQQQRLTQEADSLARDIQRRKQQPPSILQDRALNAVLRSSQQLADSLQSMQQREQFLDRLLRQKAEQLLGILNGDIERLGKEGEKYKRQKNLPEQERVARELLQYREWHRRCQELLAQPPPAIIIYEVQVLPEDSREVARRKADFLRDQADRLQNEAKRVDEKIAEIRNQIDVNERVNDLARDLSLLDPSRELTPNFSTGGAPATSITDIESGESRANFLTAQPTLLPITQNWPTNITDLSVDQLKQWQKILEQEKRRRQFQADSLNQRAGEIESGAARRP
jgi:hypothetical protein